jgi:hypothetical protein
VSLCHLWLFKRCALCREVDVTEVDMTQVSPHPFNDLAIEFVGELCKCTRDAPTEEAHREALQAFCNVLLPWVDPSEVPCPLHAALTLLKDYCIDHQGIAWVILTQEGLALFCAWLRSRGGDPTLCSS